MIMDNRLKAKAIIDNECINCGDGKRSRHSNEKVISFAASGYGSISRWEVIECNRGLS